jgi:hypothetical protein
MCGLKNHFQPHQLILVLEVRIRPMPLHHLSIGLSLDKERGRVSFSPLWADDIL